jgi:cobalt-zinc-cadmium efflux system membrane fusion protein
MNARSWTKWLIVPLCLLVVGCPREKQDSEQDQHHHDEGEGHAGDEKPDASTVRVERSMLRDLRLTTALAESRPAGDAVTVLGELVVSEEAYAEVGAPIPARVAKVLAAPGDVVTLGQALVELDSPEVGQARAAVQSSRARLDLAKANAERKRQLGAEQIVAQREVQVADAELEQARAESVASQEVLSALGAQKGSGARFVLAAPVAGTVIERSALLGRLVDATQPLFVIGDLRRLWLVVHAFERDALRMRAGAKATVSFPALPGQSVLGPVTRVGSRVDPTSRTVDVRIELDNPGPLRPGMSASALVPLGDAAESVVTVPIESIQRAKDGWCVFLPRAEEGSFELRPVGRGRDLGREVEILSGLGAGERVVVDGAFLLRAEADKSSGGGDHHHH